MQGSDYGSFSTNKNTQSINVNEVIKSLRKQFTDSLLIHPLSIGGQQVSLVASKTGQGGLKYWFICPVCGSRVGKLYISQTNACRRCVGVKYASSRYKGMPENQVFKKDI